MKTNSDIISFIREIREKHPHIGKEKIKPLLDNYCRKRGTSPVSVPTIGKVIKRYNLTFNLRLLNYHNPDSGWAKRKKKRNPHTHVRYSPKIDEPGYIEIDTIIEFETGIRMYIYNAIDVNTRFHSPMHLMLFLQKQL